MDESGTTMGVEEEFLLFDQSTRRPVGRGAEVVATSRRVLGAQQVVPEISPCMVETVSSVHRDGAGLLDEVRRLRGGVSRAAEDHGCVLVASGVPPVGDGGPPPVCDASRYHDIVRHYGRLTDDQGVCACHVHIGVPDIEEAVQVVNHLRPWLPLLLALSANSPVWQGADTGYASWRSMLWGRWPASGPPPYLESAAHYEALVAGLVSSGAVLDPGMLYWSARPSRHVPTVEIRIADVMPTAEDTVAYALLVRALVKAALHDIRRGRPAPRVQDTLLTAACWSAARDGIRAVLVDPVHGLGRLTVRGHVEAARARTGPWHRAPREGQAVGAWLERKLTHGTGADRQRRAHTLAATPDAAVDAVAVGAGARTPAARPGRTPIPR